MIVRYIIYNNWIGCVVCALLIYIFNRMDAHTVGFNECILYGDYLKI